MLSAKGLKEGAGKEEPLPPLPPPTSASRVLHLSGVETGESSADNGPIRPEQRALASDFTEAVAQPFGLPASPEDYGQGQQVCNAKAQLCQTRLFGRAVPLHTRVGFVALALVQSLLVDVLGLVFAVQELG